MNDKLIFATGNPHKVKEVNEILKGILPVISMRDIGATEDIPETEPTLEGCALQKARYLNTTYQVNCFSEDTGLEVEALNGEPGVFTARYAGEQKDPEANIRLLLSKLGENPNRKAQFRTVIALILDNEEHLFEGIAKGTIAYQKEGTEGFGYDPIFKPKGYDRTFANMTADEKNKISHRAKAVKKLIRFLKNRT